MSSPDMRTLDVDLGQWVAEWYRALDRHDDVESVLPYLVDDGLELRFPEGTFTGHAGFRAWYEAVTTRFFDEVHEVKKVEVQPWEADRTTAKVVVNWQATVWDPPAPRSGWLGFDAYQTWELVRDRTGRPRVRVYAVDSLEPMAGSASL